MRSKSLGELLVPVEYKGCNHRCAPLSHELQSFRMNIQEQFTDDLSFFCNRQPRRTHPLIASWAELHVPNCPDRGQVTIFGLWGHLQSDPDKASLATWFISEDLVISVLFRLAQTHSEPNYQYSVSYLLRSLFAMVEVRILMMNLEVRKKVMTTHHTPHVCAHHAMMDPLQCQKIEHPFIRLQCSNGTLLR